jgi:hypothetical protein
MNSKTHATLSFSDSDQTIDLPIYQGSLGPDVIDIRKLYGQTGKFTYDPGFMSTHVIPQSRISTVTRANCCIAATRSTTSRRTPTSSKPAICC